MEKEQEPIKNVLSNQVPESNRNSGRPCKTGLSQGWMEVCLTDSIKSSVVTLKMVRRNRPN